VGTYRVGVYLMRVQEGFGPRWWAEAVRRSRSSVTTRCYGFLRRRGSNYEAWWSGNKFDDHLIAEFADKALAIEAVVKAATGDDPIAANQRAEVR
jgi:hypothetical protein